MAFEFARSVSQRRTVRTCGRKYDLHYGQRWKTRYTKAGWQFGTVINHCVDLLLHQGGDTPADTTAFFQWLWEGVQTAGDAITYPEKKPWLFWYRHGIGLMPKIAPELLDRCQRDKPLFAGRKETFLTQPRIYYTMPGGLREQAIPDYLGYLSVSPQSDPSRRIACRAVVDWKTSDKEYPEIAAERDEQLTSYQLAAESIGFVPDVLALCVLIHQDRNPRVQWLIAPRRTEEEKAEFIASAQILDRQIRNREFAVNDRACTDFGGCEYQPLCFPSQAHRREKELVREPPRDGDGNDTELIEDEL